MPFTGEASDHQGSHFEKPGNEASDARQQRLPLRSKSFENVLVEKKKRLDGMETACPVDDREVPVLDTLTERILQYLVVAVILAQVGETGLPSGTTGDFVARHDLYAKRRCSSRPVRYACCISQTDCV
ncbi:MULTISPECIES: hypothetical protein [Bradyrhizobium]|uniref:hypothetical protein n=1 Tax=Bradyrhizobium pachyrhizi TaxID=280333 RepID=UPI0032DE9D11